MRKARSPESLTNVRLTDAHFTSEGFLNHRAILELPAARERHAQLMRELAPSRHERIRDFAAEKIGRVAMGFFGRIERGGPAASDPNSIGNRYARQYLEARDSRQFGRGVRSAQAINRVMDELSDHPDVLAREAALADAAPRLGANPVAVTTDYVGRHRGPSDAPDTMVPDPTGPGYMERPSADFYAPAGMAPDPTSAGYVASPEASAAGHTGMGASGAPSGGGMEGV